VHIFEWNLREKMIAGYSGYMFVEMRRLMGSFEDGFFSPRQYPLSDFDTRR
jgi:hypothetical protein